MSRSNGECRRIIHGTGIITALIAICVLPCLAQQQDHSAAIRTMVKEAVQSRVEVSLARGQRELYEDQYNQLVHLYALMLLQDSLGARALADATEARTDTQPGAQAGSGGATSLVTKGLAPKVLSWAVEHGALDRSVDDSIVTFRGNPSGIVRALSKTEVLDVMLPDRSWWNGLSFAVSFDATRGSDAGTFLANRQQVSSWSVRSEVLNRRDPTASGHRALWNKLGGTVFRPLTNVNQQIGEAIEQNTELWSIIGALKSTLSREVDANLTPTTPADQRTVLQARADEIADPFLIRIQNFKDKVSEDPFLSSALENYRAAWEPALASRAELQDWIAKGVLLTADWTVVRDPQLPDLHTATWIFEFSPDGARRHDLTFNGSVSFYGSSPANNVSSFRDSKVTAQYDIPLQTGTKIGAFVLSLAGRWEHIPNKTPVNTATMAALASAETTGDSMGGAMTPMIAPGNVGVFQLKLSIPVKGAGIQIPLALTASNRKAQIQEKWSVGMNFGITFNFDSFLTAFKAK